MARAEDVFIPVEGALVEAPVFIKLSSPGYGDKYADYVRIEDVSRFIYSEGTKKDSWTVYLKNGDRYTTNNPPKALLDLVAR